MNEHGRTPVAMLQNRSVIEIMILIFTFMVALAILLLGVSITIVEIAHPEEDTSAAASALINLISAILGALLGLLAGKTEYGGRPFGQPAIPYQHPEPRTESDPEP